MPLPPYAAAGATPMQAPAETPPLWLRLPARLPLPVLYALATALSFLLHRVLGYRVAVVRANLAGCFPDASAAERRRIEHGYYRNLAQITAEVVKSAALDRDALTRRVGFANLDLVQGVIVGGSSVLIAAAHQCNWEWLLLALSARLGHPLDAAYKPLKAAGPERAMRALRSRFGGRLIPAKELLSTLLKSRGARGIAMVADQEPVSSDYQHWTRFLGRPTAFYMGPEKIAQVTRAAVVFAGMRRRSRGEYTVEFRLLAGPREPLSAGTLTERYARAVEAGVRAAPSDWAWSHRRWKLQPGPGAVDSST